MKHEKHPDLLSSDDMQHYLQCPECRELFDMRDLLAVLLHHHREAPVPEISWTHSSRVPVPMRFPEAPQAPN
ncbi:MAG: hypothetical protein EOO16_15060 [Chitinophagaceae bacterium]|nr:MAG: hypothetical protein EOO16_15060 [Chitinophagaceae bacterium]